MKSYIVETYTSQADDLYQEVKTIKYPDYIPPYTSCYESLSEFKEIITKTREMKSAERDIRKKFQEINALRPSIRSISRSKNNQVP